jgi:homoserine dehydrogenase
LLKIALLGLGNLPRSFLQILQKRPLPFPLSITGVSTGNHGHIVSPQGLGPSALLGCYQQKIHLTQCPGAEEVTNAYEVIARSGADLVLLCTPLDPHHAQPGLSLCRAALSQRKSVISVDKGPIAFAYQELKSLAQQNGVQFRYEGTVMDGMPIFSLAEKLLPGVQINGFQGILNSTSGLILEAIEAGKTFDEGLQLAQELGIAEADPSYDLDGFDAQMKTCALANALLGASITPPQIQRRGLGRPSREEITEGQQRGQVLRLLSSAQKLFTGEIIARVEPTWLPSSSILGVTKGAASVLVLQTDLMGELALYERDPQIEQSAYALYLDLCLYFEDKQKLCLPALRASPPPHKVQ